MILTTVTFYLLSTICVVSAVGTVFLTNPVTCALSLVACLVSLAGLFAQLAAGYVAILQVLVYVGAIMVLFLFVVMLLNLSEQEALEGPFDSSRVVKVLLCLAFLADLCVFLDSARSLAIHSVAQVPIGTLAQVGEAVFARYLIAFEAVGVLLTAAVVGVVLITRKPQAAGRRGEGGRA